MCQTVQELGELPVQRETLSKTKAERDWDDNFHLCILHAYVHIYVLTHPQEDAYNTHSVGGDIYHTLRFRDVIVFYYVLEVDSYFLFCQIQSKNNPDSVQTSFQNKL